MQLISLHKIPSLQSYSTHPCCCYHKAPTLTHWGRVTHICVGNRTIIVSDNGLSLGRRQAIIWNNAGILLIGPLGTNPGIILIGTETFSVKKMNLKMSSGKSRPFCLGLNVLQKYIRSVSISCRNRRNSVQKPNLVSHIYLYIWCHGFCL